MILNETYPMARPKRSKLEIWADKYVWQIVALLAVFSFFFIELLNY